MKERRGENKNERMPDSEARARIIRFNEGGTLFDHANEYLTIDDLRTVRDSLISKNHKLDFLYAVMHYASVTATTDEWKYKEWRREYKRLYKNATQLRNELGNEPPTLF